MVAFRIAGFFTITVHVITLLMVPMIKINEYIKHLTIISNGLIYSGIVPFVFILMEKSTTEIFDSIF